MADQYKKPYLDSSVFISWIKMEEIKGVQRGKIATHILNLAEKGEYLIYTSAWTLAEVHKRKATPPLSSFQDDQVLSYFEQEFIRLINIDRLVGEEANWLCRQYGLKPADSIHLACALRAECDVLLAWDSDLFKITHPNIRIEEPQLIGQGDFTAT